jgi:hypothetical protein
MRPASLTTRMLRSLTALVTVWCLGCSAFDPLLQAMVGAPGARLMNCASESAVATAAPSAGASARTSVVIAPATEGGTDAGVSCGCDSCHAPAPSSLALTLPPAAVPQRASTDPTAPASVERSPLVPPPQAAA